MSSQPTTLMLRDLGRSSGSPHRADPVTSL
jgi:hypothetical protein